MSATGGGAPGQPWNDRTVPSWPGKPTASASTELVGPRKSLARRGRRGGVDAEARSTATEVKAARWGNRNGDTFAVTSPLGRREEVGRRSPRPGRDGRSGRPDTEGGVRRLNGSDDDRGLPSQLVPSRVLRPSGSTGEARHRPSCLGRRPSGR